MKLYYRKKKKNGCCSKRKIAFLRFISELTDFFRLLLGVPTRKEREMRLINKKLDRNIRKNIDGFNKIIKKGKY